MQEKKSISSIKILLLLLIICSSTFCGDIVLTRIRPFAEEFPTFEVTLQRDGHRIFGSGVVDTFVSPLGFDSYWILPDNEYLLDSNIAQLEVFVKSGGNLILVLECRGDVVEAINRIFGYETWFEELGRPKAYNEYVFDSVPDTFISYFGYLSSTFITDFDSRWERVSGIDTLITMGSVSVGVDTEGCLRAIGWGGRDCYGHPYGADTVIYDSFAVQILAGNYREGEITVVADINLFSTYPYDQTDVITLFDNLQFARQLFACNTRADSATIEQEDSTLRLRIFGDFADFNPDSSVWRFRIFHHWTPRFFDGYEIGARALALDVLEIDYPPIYHPDYDTVEVCLMFLPDSTGETVLWDFPVCDTFKFDFTGITETPTPQAFAISAYPNPFNSSVTIALDIPVGDGSPVPISVEIYDVNGRKIAQLPVGEGLKPSRSLTGAQTGGSETAPLRNGVFVWQPAPSMPSGVYLVRAKAGGETSTRRVVYLK